KVGMGKKGSGVNNGGRTLKSINNSVGNRVLVRMFLVGLNKDEHNTIMDAIMDLCGKLLAATSDNEYSPKVSVDMSDLVDNSFGKEQPANVDISFVSNLDMPIVQSVFIPKPISYVGAAGASSDVPKKGRANFCPLECDNVCDGVDLTIPKKVIKEDGISLIATQIGNPITLDSFTSSMCTESWGRSSFACCLIEVSADATLKDSVTIGIPLPGVFLEDEISLIATQIGKPIMLDSFTSSMCTESSRRRSFACCLIKVSADATLKDSVTIGIPLPDGEGFTKETVQVEYEWKPPCCDHCKIFGHLYDQCHKNVTSIPTVDKINNDGFQMVVNKRKSGKTGSTIYNRSGDATGKATWQHYKQKVSYEPKALGNLPKNGAPKVSNYAKDDPYKKLSATKGGLHVSTSKPSVPTFNPYDVLDDMKSEEEADVVYDESVIIKDARTGASTFMALDEEGRVEDGLVLLKRMMVKNMISDSISYSLFVYAVERLNGRESVRRANEMLTILLDKGFVTDVNTFSYLIAGYGRECDVEGVLSYIMK
nr:hypothetical protein [Tanacetum cinerariifolium]